MCSDEEPLRCEKRHGRFVGGPARCSTFRGGPSPRGVHTTVGPAVVFGVARVKARPRLGVDYPVPCGRQRHWLGVLRGPPGYKDRNGRRDRVSTRRSTRHGQRLRTDADTYEGHLSPTFDGSYRRGEPRWTWPGGSLHLRLPAFRSTLQPASGVVADANLHPFAE